MSRRHRGGSKSNKRGGNRAKALLAPSAAEDVVYEDLPIDREPELHELGVKARECLGRLSNNKIEAARVLYGVRYSLSYNQWAKWVKTELHEILMISQADNYVRVIQRLKKYEEKRGVTVESTVIANVGLSSFIELSRKGTPEFVFDNALDRAKLGYVPSHWVKDEIRTALEIKRAARQAKLDEKIGKKTPARPEKEGATAQQLRDLHRELVEYVWLNNENLCAKCGALHEDEVRVIWSNAGAYVRQLQKQSETGEKAPSWADPDDPLLAARRAQRPTPTPAPEPAPASKITEPVFEDDLNPLDREAADYYARELELEDDEAAAEQASSDSDNDALARQTAAAAVQAAEQAAVQAAEQAAYQPIIDPDLVREAREAADKANREEAERTAAFSKAAREAEPSDMSSEAPSSEPQPQPNFADWSKKGGVSPRYVPGPDED